MSSLFPVSCLSVFFSPCHCALQIYESFTQNSLKHYLTVLTASKAGTIALSTLWEMETRECTWSLAKHSSTLTVWHRCLLAGLVSFSYKKSCRVLPPTEGTEIGLQPPVLLLLCIPLSQPTTEFSHSLQYAACPTCPNHVTVNSRPQSSEMQILTQSTSKARSVQEPWPQETTVNERGCKLVNNAPTCQFCEGDSSERCWYNSWEILLEFSCLYPQLWNSFLTLAFSPVCPELPPQ